MSSESDEERVRRLAELKSYLERRLEELQAEVERCKSLMALVDEQLTARSFKTVAAVKEQKAKEVGTIRNLRGKSGNLLGTLTVTQDEIRLTVNPELHITSDMRPFSSFLIKKVLDAMVRVDKESVEAGKLDPERALTYDIVYDDDEVREIIVRNYRDDVRLREVVNSIRWALDTIASSAK